MRISLQPAFILHQRPYRETSLLVDLLTRDYGRIGAVARGVRTARSRTRAILQPFYPLLVSWQGRTELMSLSAVETQGAPVQLQGDCLLSAFYINELIVRVMHKHDSHPRLYTIYHEILLELQHTLHLEKTLRIFEKTLLNELGYGLQLQHEMDSGKPFNAEQYYCYYPEQGFKLHTENMNIAPRLIFSGKSLLAIAANDFDDSDFLRDAKRLMRLAYAPLLGSQPLQSRKLFLEVEKNEHA